MVEVAIEFVPKHRAIAAKVAELSVKGSSPLTIVRALGTSLGAVEAALISCVLARSNPLCWTNL